MNESLRSKESRGAAQSSREKNILPDEKRNKLQLAFSAKNPGEYPASILLKSQNGADIRMYKVLVKVNPRVTFATMQMKTAARQPIKQEIPLTNNSDRDFTIKYQLQTDSPVFKIEKGLNAS